MAVGLLTVHSSVNYGASLQAYALFKKLKEYSDDVYILNYRPVKFSDLTDKRKYVGFKKFIINKAKYTLYKKQILNKNKRFGEFSTKYLSPFTEELNCICDETLKKYNIDKVVCGSDQIWNPYNTNYDLNYFFTKVGKNIKKISYAASTGLDDTSLIKSFLKENLKNLDMISVREDEPCAFINSELKFKATQVLDPVFLYDKKSWTNLDKKPDNMIDDPFLLVYALADNAEYVDIIRKIASLKNLKVVVIQAGFKKKFDGDLIYKDLGPEEFLYLINKASFVVTNSFHGTAFSIIYNKQFIVFGNPGKNIRMDSVLRTLNLSDLMIRDKKEFENKFKLIFSNKTVSKSLNNEISKSIKFIESIFKGD